MQLVDHAHAKVHEIKSLEEGKKIAAHPDTFTDNYSIQDGNTHLLRVTRGDDGKLVETKPAGRPTAAAVAQPSEDED